MDDEAINQAIAAKLGMSLPYTYSIKAAWEIVEHLRLKKMMVRVSCIENMWVCEIIALSDFVTLYPRQGKAKEALFKSAPLAISTAFLDMKCNA